MRPAAEASLPAPVAGYSGRQAMLDLLGGARHARRPVRRRGGAALPWAWIARLLVTAGIADGLDVYLRSPFGAADLPAELRSHLGLVNLVGLPLVSILAVTLFAILFAVGAKVFLARDLGIAEIATAIGFGFWSAILPVLLAAGIGGGLGLSPDLVAILVACVALGYVAPSVAELTGVRIGRAVAALLIGPLALLAGIAVVLLAFGFSVKTVGYRL